jgi:hypothetical protein
VRKGGGVRGEGVGPGREHCRRSKRRHLSVKGGGGGDMHTHRHTHGRGREVRGWIWSPRLICDDRLSFTVYTYHMYQSCATHLHTDTYTLLSLSLSVSLSVGVPCVCVFCLHICWEVFSFVVWSAVVWCGVLRRLV